MDKANSLEGAMNFFLENSSGTLLCMKEGENMECSTYPEAQKFFEDKDNLPFKHYSERFEVTCKKCGNSSIEVYAHEGKAFLECVCGNQVFGNFQ